MSYRHMSASEQARAPSPVRVKREISSIASRRVGQGTGKEGCRRLQDASCKGGNTRYYGDLLPGGGFTGWRGPYCSVGCYRAEYTDQDIATGCYLPETAQVAEAEPIPAGWDPVRQAPVLADGPASLELEKAWQGPAEVSCSCNCGQPDCHAWLELAETVPTEHFMGNGFTRLRVVDHEGRVTWLKLSALNAWHLGARLVGLE